MAHLKNQELYEEQQQIVIAGVGGTGLQVLDRIVLRGLQEARMIAIDSDLRMLNSSVVQEKIQLGRELTRGLDCGGDPELAARAVSESSGEFLEALGDSKIFLSIAGLGGGTGTGALPMLSCLAKEKGAKVINLVTLPFEFEGSRRNEQAQAALEELQTLSDVLFLLPNETVINAIGENTGVFEAFETSDDVLGQVSRGLCQILGRKGLLSVDLSELAKMFEPSVRDPGQSCWVGWGEDASENRSHAVVEMILNGPFLSHQEFRKKADEVLISITGGENILLSEVEYIVRQLTDAFPHGANLLLATRIDENRGDELSVFVICSKTSLDPFNGIEQRKTLELPQQRFQLRVTVPEISTTSSALASESQSFIKSNSDNQSTSSPGEFAKLSQYDEATEIQEEFNKNKLENREKLTTGQIFLEQEILPKNSVETRSEEKSIMPHAVHDLPRDFFEKHSEQSFNEVEFPVAEDVEPSHSEQELQTKIDDSSSPEKTPAHVVDPYKPEKSYLSSKGIPMLDALVPITEISSTSEALPQKTPENQSDSKDTATHRNQVKSEQPPELELAAITPAVKAKGIDENTQILTPPTLETHPHRLMSAVTEKNQKIDPHSSKKVLKYNLNKDDFEILEHDVAKPVRTSRQKDRQEVLKFDSSSSQGRFEKTDATIHKGENLDIPTFLRKNFTIRQVVE